MKLVAEFGDGKKVELKELTGINPESRLLIMKLNFLLTKERTEAMEFELSNKLGIKVVLLNSYIGEVLTI